jgi:hypothetical protein
MLLSWTDFATNASSTFKQVWNDQDFTDVTLATADNQQIQAHKMIISSSSTLFRNILANNPQQKDPIIYLKGIRFKDLENVLKFIYMGQCYVGYEELQDFLDTGKDLEVSGIMEDRSHMINEEKRLDQELKLEENFSINTDSVSTELSVQENDDNNKEEKEKDFPTKKVKEKKKYQSYFCNQCDYLTYKSSLLSQHRRNEHEGLRYKCDQCPYKSKQRSVLVVHRKSRHEGVKFDCKQCDFKGAAGSVRRHTRSEPSGVRYECNMCDYKAKQSGNLGEHKKRHHKMSSNGTVLHSNYVAVKL